MYYNAMTKALLTAFSSDTKSPFFNKSEIERRLVEIQQLTDFELETQNLKAFTIGMLAILDVLLTIKNTEFQKTRKGGPAPVQQSGRTILKILNSGMLTARTGEKINVDVSKYIKIKEFKCDSDILALRGLLLVESNFKRMLGVLNSATKETISNTLVVYTDDTTPDPYFQLLKNDKAQINEAFEKAFQIFKKFDKDIKKLYKCTSSLVFSQWYLCIFASAPTVPGIDDVIRKSRNTYPRKTAVFLLGKYPDSMSIHKQLEVVYLNTLLQLREFSLTLDDKDKTQLLPEVILEKQKIMEAFNKDFQALFKALKPLSNEKILKTYKNPEYVSKLMEKKPEDFETKVDAVETEEKVPQQAAPVHILIRDATQDEYPSCDKLEITFINNNELLLTESETAYKIAQMQFYVMTIVEIFSKSPSYLHIQPPEALISDLNVYVKKVENEATQVKKAHESFIESLEDDVHKFSENPSLQEINKRHQQILPVLQKVKDDINSENPTSETLLNLRRRLNNRCAHQ